LVDESEAGACYHSPKSLKKRWKIGFVLHFHGKSKNRAISPQFGIVFVGHCA
jgi:hypothetical protein